MSAPQVDAAAPTSGASAKDGGSAPPPTAATPADTNNSQDPSPPPPSAPTTTDAGQAPADPSVAAAGTGGVAGAQENGAAGSAGAADSGAESSRQSLIDAAIEALGGGDYPWRNGGGDGEGLSAEFVKSILFSLVASGTCFRDTRSCIQTCFVIASDCKPCAADPECAETLMRVCGPLGECSP